jgi:hypothetical protein
MAHGGVRRALFGGGSFYMTYMAGHPYEGLSIVPVLLGPAGAAFFYWLVASLCAIFAVLAFALMTRRFVVVQFLELQQDELVLPRGWFCTRHIRIPYALIERVWEVNASGQTWLFIAMADCKFRITASLLPNEATYAAVKGFLISRSKTSV